MEQSRMNLREALSNHPQGEASMGFRNPGSIINSTIRREHGDAVKLKNPPPAMAQELDKLIESGATGTFNLGCQPCVVVGREMVSHPCGVDVTYSLLPVVPLVSR